MSLIESPIDRMLAMFLAIGSAHAGEPLTQGDLTKRLEDPDFRQRFNGPAPAEVTFPDEATAALAVEFQEAALKRSAAPLKGVTLAPRRCGACNGVGHTSRSKACPSHPDRVCKTCGVKRATHTSTRGHRFNPAPAVKP